MAFTLDTHASISDLENTAMGRVRSRTVVSVIGIAIANATLAVALVNLL